MADGPQTDDIDPLETQEWLESIDSVLKAHGPVRAHFLLDRLIDHARRSGAWLPFKANTAYVNTIHVSREKPYPGDRALERRIESLIRWNAVAMVVHANRVSTRVRRPHRDLRLLGDALRSRVQPFLACALRSSPRRHDLRPGTFEPGHLRARLPRGPTDGGAAAALPPGSRRQGPAVLPASLADAGILAIPDGIDGARSPAGDHAGALRALSGESRASSSRATRRSGVSSATAKWTSRSRWARSRCRCARSSTTSCS